MKNRIIIAVLLVALAAALAACDGSPPPKLTSITISPLDSSIFQGKSLSFTATGFFGDGSSIEIPETHMLTWTSSNTDVATTDLSGLTRALAPGTTTITAAARSLTASTTLTVLPVTFQSLAIAPENPVIANSTVKQFAAVATFSNNSTLDVTNQAAWTSTDTGIATISAAGLATGVGPGSATINAVLDGFSASTTLTVTSASLVSLVLSPPNQTMNAGMTKQYFAIGQFSDSTMQDLTAGVAWSSGDVLVATIRNAPDSKGLAYGVGPGSTTITATHADSGISGSTGLAVGDKTDFTPPTVKSTSPRNNDGIIVGDVLFVIYVEFSEAMLPLTINNDTFILKDGMNVSLSGEIAYSDRIATFTPDEELIHGEVYTVTVTTGVKDEAENSMAADYVWHFEVVEHAH